MKQELLSQYRSALTMLMKVIDQCPDKLWADCNYHSPYWQIAYHTLHYTALYLSENEFLFVPWSNHRPGIHQLGKISFENNSNNLQLPYSKYDLKEFAGEIEKSLEQEIDVPKLTEPSGFEWLPMNKFELHLYNLRHIQHHVGQLIERLHQNGIKGIDWIGITR